jgi:nucleoside-diphosphate-sugar epimerase
MTYAIDTSSPVLVTGATGYVAGWLVGRLVEAGVTVHAAVRDPGDAGKLRHLEAIAARGPGRIVYFKADLLDEGSYGEAMKDCAVVFHTASPFVTTVKNPQRELVDPALLGTRNVLGEARRTPSVRRVVVTSSCAAIYTDAADCANAPGGILTEDMWNTTASLGYQPYSYSKTLAEREAWAIAGGQSSWDLVTVNPCLVMGPAIGGRPTSESFAIMQRIGGGELRTGAPRLGFGVVDVRDVAEAHLAAAYTPGAKGRHIVLGHNTDLYEAARTLAPRFGKAYPLPRWPAPKWFVWLIAPTAGVTRTFVAKNVGIPFRADNSKGVRTLGLSYRPLRETMEDMFQYMIDNAYFRKR